MSEPTRTSVIANLPQETNPNFVGRDALLNELEFRLVGGDRVQVLYGLGGVGKTETALQFARRNAADYSLIWWMSAESESAVLLAYTRLATRLGHLLSPESTPGAAREQIEQLLQHRPALLIFDAAADPGALAPLLPRGANLHVLITSRTPNWQHVGHARPVPVLERVESVEFLRRASGIAGPEEDAQRLAVALGDLPLALQQAAAVLRLKKLTYGDYLSQFETQWASMLGEGLRPADYPRTVSMTWGLAFQAVDQTSPAAGDLLRLSSYLNSSRVPLTLLQEGATHLPANLQSLAHTPAVWNAALSALEGYSLAEVERSPVTGFASALGLHRLVAAVTRDRMDDGEQRHWSGIAVRLLAGTFRFDSASVATWPRCADLLPHVIDATVQAERLSVLPDRTTDLLNDAGRYLLKRAQYADARAVLERALTLCGRSVGQSHPKLSAIANNLGRAYENLGDDETALQYFAQALSIDTAALGHGHPHVAEIVNNYGICMQKKGDRDMARKQFQWAAEIYEAHYGPEHPKLAQILNNLGYALKSLNDHANAQVQLLRALTIAEMTVGPNHPTTARILYNLADVLSNAGQLSGACAHLERALAIDEATLSPTHPDVAADCQALAEVMTALHHPIEAAEYHARAARIREVNHVTRVTLPMATSLAG